MLFWAKNLSPLQININLVKLSPPIEIKGITKSYKLGKVDTPVLRGIDLTIHVGEFVAIMGPSGAGKSTLMNILGLLDVPSTGYYKFEGKRIESYTQDQLADIRNKKVGFVFQMFNLLPRLSALENACLPLVYSQVPEKEQVSRGTKVLTEVGLSHRIHHKPNEMSGGEQQRVAVARALINTPKLILADEPTGSLDSKNSVELMDMLCKLHKENKYTIVMITHEADIAAYAERVITVKDGVIEKDIRKKKK